MKKNFKTILILSTLMFSLLICVNYSSAANPATTLKGKILLQVEQNGEAWYVNPANEMRYYLGRPADAFSVMRELGLGITNKDFDSFNSYAPSRLSGRILLKVDDGGKAYYVNPDDLKMYYLGRPTNAFLVIRKLGLGITDINLIKIKENSKNLFINQLGKYSFELPLAWKVAVNKYNNSNSLFGPNADSGSGIGGVEISDNQTSIDKFLESVDAQYLNKTKITVGGISGIHTHYKALNMNGQNVVLLKNGKIYNIYINSEKTGDAKLFDQIIATFKFTK